MDEAGGSIPFPVTLIIFEKHMSNSNWYNDIQTSIAELTSQELLNSLNQFRGTERNIIADLFIKKIKNNKNFRPLIFYIGYCLAKGSKLVPIESLSSKERKIIGDVTAAIEIENIATYYINHYIDKKGDIKDAQDEKNRVLAGVMCRNIQQEIIEKLKIDIYLKLEISKILRKIDQDIASAQIYEVNAGTFKNLDSFKDENDFLEKYFERCRKISGQFYGRSVEIGYVLGKNSIARSAKKQMIVDFYTEMATLGQYGNDIGDYAPAESHSGTLEKNYYKDYGSDFKNQRLTYPNYLLLKRINNASDLNFISILLAEGFSNQATVRFIDLMKKYCVFSDCFSLLNNRFNEEKKKLSLPKSELRTLVSSSVIFVKSNKLISSVKKMIE